ncbi:hypothetical protein DPMN_108952 [Dreissena polymorpha]|uniref:UspA domain-containing protein n=1 Tax=Dreissena polymorpha TaxID=45954 RepID=A0A9D4K9E7_DREPO|nr:hypothetical protein DPMN_108952 [Dreissena polymorpha]
MAEELAKKGRTILVAMDGSKHAIHAFEWYVQNVYTETDNVIIAHCAERRFPNPPSALIARTDLDTSRFEYRKNIQDMMKDYDDQVKEVFKTIDHLAKKYNIKHILEFYHEPPVVSIIMAAEKHNADMIISGSRGNGTIRRTILGSVSDYIVHHSNVPVCIVKHEDEHHKLN